MAPHSAKPQLTERPSLPSLMLSHQRPHLASTSSQSALSAESASAIFSPEPVVSAVTAETVSSVLADDAASSLDGSIPPSRPDSTHRLHEDGDLSDRLRDQLKRNGQRSRAQTLTQKAKGKARASNTEEIQVATHLHDPSLNNHESSDPWPARKYFILTSAGKPVYASTGDDDADEDMVTASIGVMQVIISIFADEGDKLRYIDAGPVRIAFLLRAPLYLACVSEWEEPESILRTHLEYLHLQILSVIPETQLQRLFHQRYNFDLRRMLQGTDAMLDHLVAQLQHDFSLATASLQVLRLDPKLREGIGQVLVPKDKPSPTLLYALVICRERVVSLLRPKKHSVHPSDLHILLNTIFSSPSLIAPGSESWIPICLPRFSSSNLLHALVSFIHKDLGVVIVSSNKEEFFAMKEWKDAVIQQITNSYILKPLLKAAESDNYSLEEVAVQGCRHFLYKSRTTVQITFPRWQGIYEEAGHRQRLTTLYQRIYDLLHSKPPASGQGRQPAKLVFLQTEHEGVLGWSTSTFEVYLALNPLMPKTAAVTAAHGVLRWVQSKEAELFLISAPSF